LTDPLIDHETGGLATARRKDACLILEILQLIILLELDAHYPQYLWYPGVLANVSSSAEYLARRLNTEIDSISLEGDKLKKYINEEFVKNGLGILDASDDELQLIIDQPKVSAYYFADMVSRRAQIGWSTHGHSAVDVNIYGTAGSSNLRGNHENTNVGEFLREYLDVDVDAVTEELIKGSKSFKIADTEEVGWTGRIPSEEDLQFVLRHHEELYGKAP
jgi:alkaline phosphatase